MRDYNLNFPTNEKIYYRYWFLFWIGKLYYDKGNTKVELHFVNKKSYEDKISDINFDSAEVITVDISYLFEFKVGCIYDGLENKIISDSPKNKVENIKDVSKIYTYKTSIGNFPLIDNKYFLKDSKDVLGDKFSYQSIFFKSYGKEIQALISPYVWIQFFFQSSHLIKKLFSGEIFDGLDLNTIKYYYDDTSKQRIAELRYNQSKYKKGEVYQVIPHLFFKNSDGLKFLNSITSSVFSSFYNKTNPKMYPDIYIRYINFDIELQGKMIYNEMEGVRKNYLLVSSIKSLRFNNKNNHTIDKVCLVPFNSKTSTKDRENHSLEEVLVDSKPTIESKMLILNGERASRGSALESQIQTDQDFSTSLIIEFDKRLEQLSSYSVINKDNDESVGSLIRDLNNFINDNSILRENIGKEFVQIEHMSNFEFFQKVVILLSKKKEISLNTKLLGTIDLEEVLNNFGVMIVEIYYKGCYIYLIEFGISFIGLFSNINFKKLSNEYLKELIKVFKKNKSNANLEKTSLWTYLFNNSIHFKMKYNIVVYQGIKHSRVSESNTSPIKETAERILRQRVFKILS